MTRVLYGRTARRGLSKPTATYPYSGFAPTSAPVEPTTESGWETYQDGSRLFLPAGTNLCPDPQGTAQTFWPADTANTDVTPNQALPVALPADMATVTKCVKLVNDGTADAPQTAAMTVVESTDYQSSIYVYAPTVGGDIVITAENGHSFTLGTITTANAGWVRYDIASPTVAGEVTLRFKVSFAGGTDSTIYLTAACPIASSILTPYFDGSYDGCSWSGTPDASTSVRTASLLKLLPVGSYGTDAAFTIAARVTPLYPHNYGAQDTILQVRDISGAAYTSALHRRSIGSWRAASSASVFCDSGTTTYVLGAPNTLVGRWDDVANTVDLNHNGVDAPQTGGTWTLPESTLLEMGVGNWLPHYIGPIIVSPTRKSDTWTAAIQANDGAAFGSLPDLWANYMESGDLLIPLANNGYGWVKP